MQRATTKVVDPQEKKIKKETGLLEEMIRLETKIRAQREKERWKNRSHNEKYVKMFEPITRTMKSLADVQQQQQKHYDVKNEEEQPDLIDFSPEEETFVPIHTPKEEEQHGGTWIPQDLTTLDHPPQESLYKQALDSISKKDRDDGIFGLNWKQKTIGGRPYSVTGNTLFVEREDGTKAFNINDINVWMLLLKQRPDRTLDEKAVEIYRELAKKLNLVSKAQISGVRYWNRAKYKLLEHGSGLFTPSTIVIPSDRAGLLRDLSVTLAEYHAGNVGLLRRAKALIKEAKRRKFLPDF